MTADAEQVEMVTHMAMAIASAEPSPEAEERWARRAEVLAAWLAAAWRREQDQVEGDVIHGHNLN